MKTKEEKKQEEKVKKELYDFFIAIGFEKYFINYDKKIAESKRPINSRGTIVGSLNSMERIFQMAFNDSHKRLDDLIIQTNPSMELKIKDRLLKKELMGVRSVAEKLLISSLEKRFGRPDYELSVVNGFKVQILPYPNGEV